VKKDDTRVDLAYLQSLYDELSQDNWDEQRTNAESLFELLSLHKKFKEKYINKETAGMRTIIRDIAFQN
jgi:hypothetical protein